VPRAQIGGPLPPQWGAANALKQLQDMVFWGNHITGAPPRPTLAVKVPAACPTMSPMSFCSTVRAAQALTRVCHGAHRDAAGGLVRARRISSAPCVCCCRALPQHVAAGPALLCSVAGPGSPSERARSTATVALLPSSAWSQCRPKRAFGYC